MMNNIFNRNTGVLPGSQPIFKAPGQNSLPGLQTGIAASPGSQAKGAGSAGGSAGRKSGPDVGWIFWGAKAQNNGLALTASIAGYPSCYSQTGNTITLDRNRGTPWLGYGAQFSLTKPGGGAVTGALSYGSQKNFWVPALLANSNIGQALFQQVPIPYQEGEVLSGYSDSTNVNEEQVMGCLVAYGPGGFPHRYPEGLPESFALLPAKPRQIWNIDCTITAAAACAAGSGAAALDTASQADLWLDSDSLYYIMGALPQSGNTAVKNQGFLQFKNNLGEYWTMRNAAIPMIMGPGAEPLCMNPGWSVPYEPIGPFRGDALPSVGACVTVAGVASFALCLAKV